jgi:hypothetical protein
MITQADVYDFTMGACYLLADELHAATGWPKVAIPRGGGWSDDMQKHVMVQRPDGLYVDIHGAQQLRDVLDRWHVDHVIHDPSPWSQENWGLPWGFPHGERHYRDRARQLIPELLAAGPVRLVRQGNGLPVVTKGTKDNRGQFRGNYDTCEYEQEEK